jgi:adenosylcobinamide-GDP ribazoletransferase
MSLAVQEFRAMHAALIYFTRLPLPMLRDSTADDWRRAPTYFPLVGWVVGGVAAGAWWSASLLFPATIACGLSLGATLLITGAMHEDGFADVCDGLGGGTTREKALEIMRDSRVGAFGAIGLVVLLGLKWHTLATLPFQITPAALIAAHACSRAGSISIMASLDYARAEGKARPLASRLHLARLALALALGVAPLVLLPIRAWAGVAAVLVVRFTASAWFATRLGGYTGDCLGAAQQVGELAFLLTLAALAW